MIRKQRRRKEEATAKSSLDAGKDESENPQLYFQQKAELDDEQRRHEMEALELVHEMEGDDRVHEMAGDEDRRGCGRQELSGEEHAGELDGLR